MKIANVDLTSQDAEKNKIIFEDARFQLQEDVLQLKADKAFILVSMMVDQGIEIENEKCNKMREIDRKIAQKEAELNEEIK